MYVAGTDLDTYVSATLKGAILGNKDIYECFKLDVFLRSKRGNVTTGNVYVLNFDFKEINTKWLAHHFSGNYPITNAATKVIAGTRLNSALPIDDEARYMPSK